MRIKKLPQTMSFFMAAMVSCVPDTGGLDPSDFLPHPGMKKIHSAGRSFPQGWNDALATPDEKPGMRSSFSYNYWIDIAEVTQKRFFDYTGRKPVADSSAFGVGDDYPVYFVSWFDAVFFCNERSKAENLDTVYIYYGKNVFPDGGIYNLTGLRADLSKDGYRLPTESEWEFAARGSSSDLPFCTAADTTDALSAAWFSANSQHTTHPVVTKHPNALGLFDMAGNVYEWTNDWKNAYDGQSIINPLGGLQPSPEFEKVIKGGSYNYSFMHLRPSYRSATYATMVSTANEYVGFRCARGAIPNGQYIGTGQQSVTPNPVGIVIGANKLRSFIGTSESKIVFVNVTGQFRTLCLVDFSSSFSAVREYHDDYNVFLPTISPDGRYVAYCGGNEGGSGLSKITIRSLDSLGSEIVQLDPDTAYVPRWWVNRSTGDTCIVYTNSAVINSRPLWKSTKTYLQKMSGGKPVGSPEELVFNGSFHDGLSVDRQYMVSGYDRLIEKKLLSGEEKQKFLSPENGKDANGSTQVCNVSISPDTCGGTQCLFLDFGYPRKSTVTGCSYGIHQYLFISSMAGQIIKCIRYAENEQSWENPEWSNKGRFAVAGARNNVGEAHRLYIIDLNNGDYQPVVTGIELQQPYCWIGFLTPNPSHFPLDSIGRYNEPPTHAWQMWGASKLLAFWQIIDSVEVIAIGSSQALDGIDVRCFTGLHAFNLAAAGGDLPWNRVLIQHYFLNHCCRLKVICSSLDPGWLGNPDGNFSWRDGIGKSKGYTFDSCHVFWKHNLSKDFLNVIRQIPPPVKLNPEYLGFLPTPCKGWGPNPPPCIWPTTWTVNDICFQRNLQTVSMLADTLRSRGIHWIVINFPISPAYKNTTAYSLWGPSWPTALDVIKKLREIEKTNPYFHLYDANMNGNHDYTKEFGQDESHLCSTGAAKLSSRVDSLIHAVLKKQKSNLP